MNKFLTYMVEKLGRGQPPTPTNIGWNVSPKINAVFRCGSLEDKESLFRGFVGELDKDEALKIATRCHREQTATVKSVFEKCDEKHHNFKNCVTAFIPNEYKEYTGLVAAKLMSKYNKPAFVLRKPDPTNYSGSFRSPIQILELINSSNLASARGHDMAAGVAMKASNVNKFFDWFDEQDLSGLIGEKQVTACLEPDDITVELCRACEDNEALWGHGLERPTFYISAVISPDDVQVFKKRNTTIKITVKNTEFLLFMATPEQELALTSNCKNRVEMVINLSTNEWNGVVKPQGKIKQIEVTPVEDKDDELDWESIFN